MKRVYLSSLFIILFATYLPAKEINNEALPDYIFEKIDYIENISLSYSLLEGISFGENCRKGDWNCIFYLSLGYDTCLKSILTTAKKMEEGIKQPLDSYVFKISNINLVAMCTTYLNPDIVIDEVAKNDEITYNPEKIEKRIQEVVSYAKKIAVEHINKKPLSKNTMDSILEIIAIRNHDQLNDYFCLKQYRLFQEEKSEKNYQNCLLSVQKISSGENVYKCSELALSKLNDISNFSNLSHSKRVKNMVDRNFIFNKSYSNCYINILKNLVKMINNQKEKYSKSVMFACKKHVLGRPYASLQSGPYTGIRYLNETYYIFNYG